MLPVTNLYRAPLLAQLHLSLWIAEPSTGVSDWLAKTVNLVARSDSCRTVNLMARSDPCWTVNLLARSDSCLTVNLVAMLDSCWAVNLVAQGHFRTRPLDACS